MQVVAVNINARFSSLEDWRAFWRSKSAKDVLWAQDERGEAVSAYQVASLGTTVIIDREGRVRYRDGGATPYGKLKEELAKVL